MPALLKAEAVTRILPGPVPVTLVRDIDLAIEAGELVAITGPSGSGKSSLLYLLGLLDAPTSGRVSVAGTDCSRLDDDALAAMRLAKLGFVFQFHFLLPEFDVVENVMVPMRRLGALDRAQMRARAHAILGDLGLGPQIGKRVDQLSGGQRQRVAIARAMANDPPILLADEPTGNLDSKSARTVFDIFAAFAHERGKAVVAVTHDQDLARLCGRRVHMVDARIVSDQAVGVVR
jgi:lipoprotein-releasing system ATP-binding protein